MSRVSSGMDGHCIMMFIVLLFIFSALSEKTFWELVIVTVRNKDSKCKPAVHMHRCLNACSSEIAIERVYVVSKGARVLIKGRKVTCLSRGEK